MPAPHHSVFYRPYALPAAQPTASKLNIITGTFLNMLLLLLQPSTTCLQCFDAVNWAAGKASGP